MQLDHHKATIAKIKELKGNDEAAAKDYLGKCLYSVNMGSNDYMANYLLASTNPNDIVYTPDSWAQDLATRMHDFLKVSFSNTYIIQNCYINLCPCTIESLCVAGLTRTSFNSDKLVT